MSIEELLIDPRRREHAAVPEDDALTDTDALQEADLIDVRFDAASGSLALLFDLRTALQFRMANTAVMVIRDVARFEWSSSAGWSGSRVAHYVTGSQPETGAGFSFNLVCLGGWRLEAVGSSAEFFVGDVPGLPDAPPNFIEDDDATIAAGMPAWESPFEPGWATFLDA